MELVSEQDPVGGLRFLFDEYVTGKIIAYYDNSIDRQGVSSNAWARKDWYKQPGVEQ